jgi:hypothetical protein
MRRTSFFWAVALLFSVGLAAVSLAADGPKTGEKRDTLLYVRTVPSGAKVLLNGEKLGTSDDIFSVGPGVGRIVIELEGYQSDPKEVTIKANAVTRLELILKRQSDAGVAGKAPGAEEKARSGLVNPVQIEMLKGRDVLVLRGSLQDVEQVQKIIKQVKVVDADTPPEGSKPAEEAVPQGPVLTYEIDPRSTPGGMSAADMVKLLTVVNRRINADSKIVARVRALDNKQIEIALLDQDEESAKRVKRLL